MLENFDDLDGLNTNDTTPVEEAGDKVKQEVKNKTNVGALKNAFAQYLTQRPNISRGSLSQSVEISQVLGFGPEGGNIILNHEATKATGKRVMTNVTKIVGYTIKNKSKAPISILTEKYAPDGNGTYVGTPVIETVAPGQVIPLSRKYFALNGVRPEFGQTFSNGGLVLKTRNQIEDADLTDILESASFRYYKSLGMRVNDDSVKVQIGVQIEGAWKVQDEYVETFGFLNNEPVAKTRGSKKSKTESISNIEAKAFAIYQKMLEQQGNA